MTAQQNKRIQQLEAYAQEERSKLGYGSYPVPQENLPTINICTNVLAYCLLIKGDK